jgi:hypothetical protein
MSVAEATSLYGVGSDQVDGKQDGWYEASTGEPFYYISDPGLGLWMHEKHQYAF